MKPFASATFGVSVVTVLFACTQETQQTKTAASSTVAAQTTSASDAAPHNTIPGLPPPPPTTAIPLNRLSSVHDSLSCSFTALTDFDDRRPIPISDTPNGPPTHLIHHDSTSDSWTFDVDAYADGYFYVQPSTLDSTIAAGWVPSEFVKMFGRNYSRPLILRTAPSNTAPPAMTIKDWFNGYYTVTHCSGKWLEVKATVDGVLYKGWMSPDDQCDNPYTTCS